MFIAIEGTPTIDTKHHIQKTEVARIGGIEAYCRYRLRRCEEELRKKVGCYGTYLNTVVLRYLR